MIFRKTNNKYFQIFQNTLFLGHSGQYFPKLGEKCIFWEKGLCQFINIPNIYHVAKNLKKITTRSAQKFRTADGQTDKVQWFYRTFWRAGIQKVIFETEECDSLWEGKNNCELNAFKKTMVHRSNMYILK